MKKLKLTKVIASTLVVASVLALNPIRASAEWKQDSKGWWYVKGDSYLKNCTQYIDNQIYCFDENGYMKTGWIKDSDDTWVYYYRNGTMAKDTIIDGYIIAKNGNMLDGVTKSDVEYYKNMMYEKTDFYNDILKGTMVEDGVRTVKNFVVKGYDDFYVSKGIIFELTYTAQHLDPQQCIVDMTNSRVYYLNTGYNLMEYNNKQVIKTFNFKMTN